MDCVVCVVEVVTLVVGVVVYMWLLLCCLQVPTSLRPCMDISAPKTEKNVYVVCGVLGRAITRARASHLPGQVKLSLARARTSCLPGQVELFLARARTFRLPKHRHLGAETKRKTYTFSADFWGLRKKLSLAGQVELSRAREDFSLPGQVELLLARGRASHLPGQVELSLARASTSRLPGK